MFKRIVIAIMGTAILSLAAVAQQSAPADPALLAQGKQLFTSESTGCTGCHQANGEGIPPNFPALARNERLADPALIVGNLHRGAGAMPAFSHLTSDEIAALATYVRNSFGNSFGGVAAEEVSQIIAALPPPIEQVSVWTGVFSQAQADRGKIVYSGVCAKCHGRTGNGSGDPDQPESPSVARAAFLAKWDGQSVATLFEYVRTTMPQDNPKSREDQEYIDAVAYIFTLSRIPAGEKEMPPDPEALKGFVIGPQPVQ